MKKKESCGKRIGLHPDRAAHPVLVVAQDGSEDGLQVRPLLPERVLLFLFLLRHSCNEVFFGQREGGWGGKKCVALQVFPLSRTHTTNDVLSVLLLLCFFLFFDPSQSTVCRCFCFNSETSFRHHFDVTVVDVTRDVTLGVFFARNTVKVLCE